MTWWLGAEATNTRDDSLVDPATVEASAGTFSERVRRAIGEDPLMQAIGQSTLEAGAVALAPNRFGTLLSAANEEARLTSNLASRAEAIADAYDQRIARLRDVSGITLENPQRQAYLAEAEARYRMMREQRPDDFLGVPYGEGWARLRQPLQDDLFAERYSEALERLTPDQVARLPQGTTIAEEARGLARAAVERSTAAQQAASAVSPGLALGASIAGGLIGQGRDPLFWSTLFVGPNAATGQSALARVADAALKQGAFNAGLSVATQPFTQGWKAEVGLETGPAAIASEAALAFVFGAVPGGAVQGAVEALSKPARAAIERVAAGIPEPGDAGRIAATFGLDAARVEAAVAPAERHVADTKAAVGPPPKGADPAAHGEAFREALEATEAPFEAPAPMLIPLAPMPRAPLTVIDGARAGQDVRIDGKPVTFTSMAPAELATDAAAFQYKADGDAASGKAMVFEYADGRRVVADGHQRLGLAKRIAARDPAQAVTLDAYLFREADGWSVPDVRALAARKNMQEDSGEALDAARVLRDRPDLLDGTLPLSSPKMRAAQALARLDDPAWIMVTNGVASQRDAALVGAMVPDPAQHAAILSDLTRAQMGTDREARLYITEALEADVTVEQQIDLFGASISSRTLMVERVKVLDKALSLLRQDAKLFAALNARADAIEAAGNMLDRQGNAIRADRTAMAGEMVERLARRTGPLSDALSRQARAVSEGGSVSDAARAFAGEVKRLVDEGGMAALTAEPRFEAMPEPAPGARAAADTTIDVDSGDAAPTPADLFDAVIDPLDGAVKMEADTRTLPDLFESAADLIQACKT